MAKYLVSYIRGVFVYFHFLKVQKYPSNITNWIIEFKWKGEDPNFERRYKIFYSIIPSPLRWSKSLLFLKQPNQGTLYVCKSGNRILGEGKLHWDNDIDL